MKERFEHTKIGIAQPGSSDARRRVGHEGLESFHEHEPDVNAAGVLRFAAPFLFHQIIY